MLNSKGILLSAVSASKKTPEAGQVVRVRTGTYLVESAEAQTGSAGSAVRMSSMLIQWNDEPENRFGLTFEILERQYVGRMHQERSCGVNPWTTFPRLLTSHSGHDAPHKAAPFDLYLTIPPPNGNAVDQIEPILNAA